MCQYNRDELEYHCLRLASQAVLTKRSSLAVFIEYESMFDTLSVDSKPPFPAVGEQHELVLGASPLPGSTPLAPSPFEAHEVSRPAADAAGSIRMSWI